MMVEGYNVNDCDCTVGFSQHVTFIESKAYDEPRFMLICNHCGSATAACKTKEQAVHKWNSAKNLLLG